MNRLLNISAHKFMATLLVLFTVLTSFSSAFADWSDKDIIYLKNGEVIEARVKKITGEFIDYTDGVGKQHRVRRIALASHHDQLKYHYWGLRYIKTMDGEITFMRPDIIEMDHNRGRMRMWKWMRHQVVLGIPSQ